MYNELLLHYGVLGMKWGVRRTPEQLGHVSKKRKSKSSNSNKIKKKEGDSPSTSEKKKLHELSDDELRSAISRLELEKRYKDLLRADEQKKVAKGKAFVMDVLEKSGKNIAIQLATYAMGTAANKIAGSEVVNPKKGQRDK